VPKGRQMYEVLYPTQNCCCCTATRTNQPNLANSVLLTYYIAHIHSPAPLLLDLATSKLVFERGKRRKKRNTYHQKPNKTKKQIKKIKQENILKKKKEKKKR
jgi:hypothetical protein